MLFSPTDIRHIPSDFLASNGDIILPVVFLSFFIFGGIAVLKPQSARTYFVIMIVILLSTSAIFAWTLYPFTHAHRYSPMADKQTGGYDLKVVVDDHEKSLDSRTQLPLRTMRGTQIIEAETDAERLAMSEKILSDAEAFHAERQAVVPRLRHPPPSARNYWTGSEFNSSVTFEQLRIYNTTVIYERNSHYVDEIEKECVIEIDINSGQVYDTCDNV